MRLQQIFVDQAPQVPAGEIVRDLGSAAIRGVADAKPDGCVPDGQHSRIS
jgi:hypothetical protein